MDLHPVDLKQINITPYRTPFLHNVINEPLFETVFLVFAFLVFQIELL